MQWVLILLSLFMPIVQPVIQRGADKMAQRMGVQQAPQPQQQQPYVVFHEGRWWKYEHGQWYVWTQNGAQHGG